MAVGIGSRFGTGIKQLEPYTVNHKYCLIFWPPFPAAWFTAWLFLTCFGKSLVTDLTMEAGLLWNSNPYHPDDLLTLSGHGSDNGTDSGDSPLLFPLCCRWSHETVSSWTCWQTKEKWLSVWYTYYINCRRSFFMMGKQSGQIQSMVISTRLVKRGWVIWRRWQWVPGMALLRGWTVIQLTRGKVILSWNIWKDSLVNYQEIGLDGGYDIGAVHRGLELLGVQGYTAIREYQNNAMKKDSVMRKKQTALYVDRENI